MYWEILRLVLLTFVPLPVCPKLTRPDPKKNFWTFTCDDFKSVYQTTRDFYSARYNAKTI